MKNPDQDWPGWASKTFWGGGDVGSLLGMGGIAAPRAQITGSGPELGEIDGIGGDKGRQIQGRGELER